MTCEVLKQTEGHKRGTNCLAFSICAQFHICFSSPFDTCSWRSLRDWNSLESVWSDSIAVVGNLPAWPGGFLVVGGQNKQLYATYPHESMLLAIIWILSHMFTQRSLTKLAADAHHWLVMNVQNIFALQMNPSETISLVPQESLSGSTNEPRPQKPERAIYVRDDPAGSRAMITWANPSTP